LTRAFPVGWETGATLVSADFADGGPAESEVFGDATIAPAVFFVEFADLLDDGLWDRGIVVCFPHAAAVLAVGRELSHLRFLPFAFTSARLNFFATDMGTPTFFAKLWECAAAAMRRRWAGDLLGITWLPWR
jgi:hypothetical protein